MALAGSRSRESSPRHGSQPSWSAEIRRLGPLIGAWLWSRFLSICMGPWLPDQDGSQLLRSLMARFSSPSKAVHATDTSSTPDDVFPCRTPVIALTPSGTDSQSVAYSPCLLKSRRGNTRGKPRLGLFSGTRDVCKLQLCKICAAWTGGPEWTAAGLVERGAKLSSSLEVVNLGS